MSLKQSQLKLSCRLHSLHLKQSLDDDEEFPLLSQFEQYLQSMCMQKVQSVYKKKLFLSLRSLDNCLFIFCKVSMVDFGCLHSPSGSTLQASSSLSWTFGCSWIALRTRCCSIWPWMMKDELGSIRNLWLIFKSGRFWWVYLKHSVKKISYICRP